MAVIWAMCPIDNNGISFHGSKKIVVSLVYGITSMCMRPKGVKILNFTTSLTIIYVSESIYQILPGILHRMRQSVQLHFFLNLKADHVEL